MTRLAVVMAVACAASPSLAACPRAGDMAADMAGGVRMVLANGDAEVFRAAGEGLVESRLSPAQGGETRFSYARGVYLLESLEFRDGAPVPDSRATFALPMRPEQTPEPLPGHGWGVQVAASYGGSPVSEMLGLRFGPAGEVEIGGCVLAAVPMEQRIFEDGQLVAWEERTYLPELGFSYAVAWHEDDRVDRYEYISIEAVE